MLVMCSQDCIARKGEMKLGNQAQGTTLGIKMGWELEKPYIYIYMGH